MITNPPLPELKLVAEIGGLGCRISVRPAAHEGFFPVAGAAPRPTVTGEGYTAIPLNFLFRGAVPAGPEA